MLAERLFVSGSEYAGAWNFGPNDHDSRPVSWLAERLIKLWGSNAQWRAQPGNHPHEASYLKVDISKAKTRLNWLPVTELEQALWLTAEWAKQLDSGVDARTITLQQISTYQEEALNSHAE